MTGVLIKEGHLDTERESHGKKVVESGGRLPQAKVCLGLLKAGTGKEGSSPRAFRGSLALPTSCLQACGPQNCERRHFHCSKPPSLWCFVTAALAPKHTLLHYISRKRERTNLENLTVYVKIFNCFIELRIRMLPCERKRFEKC